MITMDGFSEKQTKKSGFALIEVLIALTVVAVLGGIVFPIGKAVLDCVHIMHDKTKLQMLVIACNELRDEGCINEKTSLRDLVLCLATVKGFNDVNDWRSSKRGGKSQKIVDDNGNVLVKEIISDWLIVHPFPSYGISNRTPLFYSVGLNEDGTWDAPDSPYGAKGGLIAFSDGDVVSVRNAKSVLISPETGQPTENIAETFPKGTVPVRYFQLGK